MGEKITSVGYQVGIRASVTSGTGADSYGSSYTEITTGLSVSAIRIVALEVLNGPGTAKYCRVRIASGTAGAETDLFDWEVPLSPTNNNGYVVFPYPIFVAGSTRIACKVLDDVGSTAHTISLFWCRQSDVVDDGIGGSANLTQVNGHNVTDTVSGYPDVNVNYVSGQSPVAFSGTAGTTGATSITLTGGSATTDKYKNMYVLIDSATTGAGQFAFITAYNGTTKVATINGWSGGVTPTGTITYTIIGF